MKKQPRWLKSVIAAAAEVNVPLPFARTTRRPIAVRVQALAAPVLRHRLLLTFAAEAEQISADDVVAALLKSVPFPG